MLKIDDVQGQHQEASRHQSQAMSSCPMRRRMRTREKEEVGAPAVWIAPDWRTHPVIENFYGHARRARASSFDEVMHSPMNAAEATTLGASCCSYKAADDDNDEVRRFVSRRPFGSFAYSCTTDTSEEHLSSESLLYDRSTSMGVGGESSSLCPDSGLTRWDRIRQTFTLNGGLVPIPPHPHRTLDRTSLLSIPHGNKVILGGASLGDSNCDPDSPGTAARLQAKLLESLQEIDARIAGEYSCLYQTQQIASKKRAQEHIVARTTVMWSLLCGAQTSEASQSDGLAFLAEKLGVAVSHRALNQLQRYRRHVSGILQIVMAHNPDLELTERQMDSFEAANAMLANDIKYTVLNQQHKLLMTSVNQRFCAAALAKLHNGNDCFEIPHIKRVMLSKLLEAVSWYRLVQRNAREESASRVASTPESSLSDSCAESSCGLQEVQVDKILDVLAGEDFYSEFNELMCRADWWEIAQAYFENLIFSSKTSRICQWVLQLSKDVAAVSHEALEENEHQGRDLRTSSVTHHGKRRQRALWARDPCIEQITDFLTRLTGRVRREFDVPADVSKSLNVFIQRTIFPRIALLCFNQKATRECQRKDKLWRKKCIELNGLPMESLGVSPELVAQISSGLPSHCEPNGNSPDQRQVFLVRAIEAFSGMESIVPCDLLNELMHGVVILHHEAAQVLGTTQFSVETFFPLLAYTLVHCQLPTIHAQLHLLENFAITADNANGEESYYVYCVHAAVEYVCNTAGLGVPASLTQPVNMTSSAHLTPDLASATPMLSAIAPSNYQACSSELDSENAPMETSISMQPHFDNHSEAAVV
ncbi:uncharacterized protein CCR75_009038 [Bremia lactucae]|uniref:VPS9 domain-containing protein n=1 Tax=Bremia lactucae TaxID=4779 RepID=A0A976NY35_BRELC|nr:hypothetical protein CCR75_009038 [Bremia lactucae]